MRAILFEKPGKPLRLINMDVPDPAPGEMVLKVHRCGICGSDVHLTEEHGSYPENSVLGHEYAGEVVALGKGVEGFRIGSCVTAMPVAGCGMCLACLQGEYLVCERGFTPYSGGFADYVRVAAASSIELPQTLSLADGALVEPLSVGLHGIVMAKITPGTRVLVVGGGAVGLAAIYWARRLGAGRIAALSRSQRRADMALHMGADAFVQAGDNEVGAVQEALGGSPQVVIEAIGVPGALMQCAMHAARNGRIVSLGFCTKPDSVLPIMATAKQLTLTFSMAYSLSEFQYCADTLDRGHVDPGVMISRAIALEDVPAAIEQMRSGGGTDIKIHADMAL